MSALANTADKLSRMFATERCPPLCQEQRDSVLQCCKENSQKPLLCSEAVKKFSSCVHSTRMVSFSIGFRTVFSPVIWILSQI